MPQSGSRVEVDASDFLRGLKQLGRGLTVHVPGDAMVVARAVAAAVKDGVPVVSGKLSGTVGAVPITNGAGVTYGGGLVYAWINQARSHAVDNGTEDADTKFRDAMYRTAKQEVSKL